MCLAANGLCYFVISFFPSVPVGGSCTCSHQRETQHSLLTGAAKHLETRPSREQSFPKCSTCREPSPHLEVVYLLIGALLLRSVFQHGPSHQRRGDLRTGGQQFNGLPQKCPFASQLDSQSQSQQLLALPLVSSSLVGDQLSSQTSSAFFSLHASPFGFPRTLHLLRGKAEGVPETALELEQQRIHASQRSTQGPD